MKRRKFVRNTGIALGALSIGGVVGINSINSKISEDSDSSILLKNSKKWSNWSENQICEPKSFFLPKNEDDLIKKLKNSTDKFRIVGGGHSFSPVVPTNDILASLKNLNGILTIDSELGIATIGAGSHLYNLTNKLHEKGLAFPNQGDIDVQTLGGAVSTSTHGTGKDLQSFAGFIKGFRLITANGEVLDCSAEQNSELFYGGTVALGCLGVVSQYTVQLSKSFKLKEHVYVANLEDVLDDFWNLAKTNRHFELFPFFYSDKTIVKTLNETSADITEENPPLLSDDFLLALGITASGDSVSNTKRVQKLMANLITPTERVNYSHKIFPSVRNVKFNEMEYQLPVEKGIACLREVIKMCRDKNLPVFFPLEVRLVKQDDFWMSPFYKRDVMSISIHQFNKKDYKKIFPLFHNVFKKHGGRPHWGKLNFYDKEGMKNLYPKYDDFIKLRNELDPNRRFSNDYITKMFG